jgi:predicted TPR repeat methyltransferase
MDPHKHCTTSALKLAWEQGKSLRLAGRPAEALQLLGRALAAGQDDYRIHDEIGMALVALNRPEEAIGSFLTAFRLNPDFGEACHKIGSAFASRGLFEPAAEWFARGLQLNAALSTYFYTYGHVLVQLNCHEQAAEVFDQWVNADPENPIARHLASAVLRPQSVAKAAPEYVQKLFDSWAVRFDESLAKLNYRGPELVARALERASAPPACGWDVLDAGCGTGLVGVALKPFARRLVGVDLSTGMLEIARRRAIYSELFQSDIVQFLSTRTHEFDAVTASDLLTYVGDLKDFFTHAARALRPGGLIAMAAEALKEADGYRLNPSGRFSHSRNYLQAAMESAGIAVVNIDEDVMRFEAKKPVATWIAIGATSKD